MRKVESIVPEYLLEKFAEKGSEKAQKSLEHTKKIHEKRKNLIKNQEIMDSSLENNKEHKATIHVYDCQHTEQPQHKLVRDEGDSPTDDEDANQAYDAGKVILEYYKKVLHRNSIDNHGLDLIFNVHYSNHFMNAFWDGEQMIFGDGDGEIFIDFTGGIDVIAHEMSHGVTQYTSKLEYHDQPGALNESFSDCIGSAIKQYHLGQNAQNADWLIGDKIIGPKFPGKALRSMKEPGTANEHDSQPNHMDKYDDGSNLNFETEEKRQSYIVHTNSGIPNKAFYLVSMGIGTDNAAILWYNAWPHLHPNSGFHDAFEEILKAAKALINEGKMPQNTDQVVNKAFSDVGIVKS
ncbi:peptidase M4 family protein [Bacillus toyonensis]|uniref:Neutral metalloproteinase n=1 Tax=Bacillus toyonensis TaxID=155322 RepID=A0AB73R546_9BACI|nr:M4 family metallopeptidase [Bacillus toyonensis]PEI84414.1 peptidase M4 family protein [Bacillus toyonensis]PEK39532.1 peptidase M4 family protein [Bacillus toyonensis]PEM40122.1 peptidase M4 family protein [Bacillus toyonensis]PHE86128.1 peptidase M4 family protein [Bacillus toyonensis]